MKDNQKKLKAVIYIRVGNDGNTERQAENIRKRLIPYRDRLEICDEISVLGQSSSGIAKEAKRKIIEQLSPECDMVVLLSRDRWARNVKEFLEDSAEVEAKGCKILTINELEEYLSKNEHRQRLWAVSEQWCCNCDTGSSVGIFSTKEKARKHLDRLVEKELSQGFASQHTDKDGKPNGNYILTDDRDDGLWEFYDNLHYNSAFVSFVMTEVEVDARD